MGQGVQVTQALASLNPDQVWIYDGKKPADQRFTIIEKKDQKVGQPCCKIVDMARGLKAYAKELEASKADIQKDEMKATNDKAFVAVLFRVQHMNMKVDQRNVFVRIWLSIVQLFTGNNLKAQFEKVRQLLEPTIERKELKAVYNSKLLQPYNTAITTALHKFNTDYLAFKALVEKKDVPADKQAEHNDQVNKGLADLLTQADSLHDFIIGLEHRILFQNWLDKKPAPKAAPVKEGDPAPAPAPKVTYAFLDLLESKETYLTYAAVQVLSLYNLSGNSAKAATTYNKWIEAIKVINSGAVPVAVPSVWANQLKIADGKKASYDWSTWLTAAAPGK